MNKLTILLDDNGTFSDLTESLKTYSRDSETVAIVALEDALYIKLHKPIGAVYVEMATVNLNSGTITGQYYNGTVFTDLEGFYDETKHFTRSGFIRWNLYQVDQAETTVNNEGGYWYKFTFSTDLSVTTTIQGMNIVFSDDIDLKDEYFEIADLLPSGASSFILKHQAARDEIMQKIRNDGRWKIDLSTGTRNDLNQWDILNFDQIRQASKYLTLSKIFMNISNEVGDTHDLRSSKYHGLYLEAINTFYLDIDEDDDGARDIHEELMGNDSVLVRR